ncbi:hypothetical protein MMC20_006480 [Loxospora ochrophaea]|nr:hypothetical protein [Loxospora ochrophaea]
MASPLPPDPYETLGVSKDASLTTIRSAHRKLVLTCHPDKVHDETAKAQKADQFQQVQQAYEILSDDTRRQRYDERVKLAELRAALLAEKGGARAMGTVYGTRSSTAPVYEVRGGRMYEERVPSRSYDEGARYEEPRARKYEDRYDTTSRRYPARPQEEKRRHYEDDRDREREQIRMQKATEKTLHSTRKKTREQDRKEGHSAKSRTKYYSVETESESDSDTVDAYYSRKHEAPSKKKYQDSRTREREEISEKKSKRDDSDYADDLESKHLDNAKSYIQTSRRSGLDTETRRPTAHRTNASYDTRQTPPPPPAPVDTARRSSARDTRSSSKPKKDRAAPEIVDPPSRSHESPRTKFGLNIFSSGKASTSSRGPTFNRSSTMQPASEPHKPSIRRAETSPLSGMTSSRRNTPTTKHSKPRKDHDSGYSSPGTPESYTAPSPQFTSTSYKVETGSTSESDSSDYDNSTIVVEPQRRTREASPKSRRAAERPAMSRGPSGVRITPIRTESYSHPPDSTLPPRFTRTKPDRPSLSKNQSSARVSPLYGEIHEELYEEPQQYGVPYKVVRESPKVKQEDIRYSSGYARRGSEAVNRDEYPGSRFNEQRRNSSFARTESYAH